LFIPEIILFDLFSAETLKPISRSLWKHIHYQPYSPERALDNLHITVIGLGRDRFELYLVRLLYKVVSLDIA